MSTPKDEYWALYYELEALYYELKDSMPTDLRKKIEELLKVTPENYSWRIGSKMLAMIKFLHTTRRHWLAKKT